MITTTTFAHTVSNVFARIFGTSGSSSLSRSERAAVERAYAAFAGEHPGWVAGFFDKDFLLRHGSDVIAAALHGLQSRSQAAAELARRWDRQLGPATTAIRKRRIADVTPVAEHFVRKVAVAGSADDAAGSETPFDSRISVDETGAVRVDLAGQLDHKSYLRLLDQIDSLICAEASGQHCRRLTIDVTAVDSIGLSGIYVLHATAAALHGRSYPDSDTGLPGLRRLAEQNIAGGRNRNAVITGCSPAVRVRLAEAGLDRVYTLSA